MGFLKKQAAKSADKKTAALNDVLSGESVVLEFKASMVHPGRVSGIQSSKVGLGAAMGASPAICWITETRLLIAFKNMHAESTKISDGIKLLAEPVNVYIAPLNEISDIQLNKFGKSNGMTLTTRNAVYQFVLTDPSPSEIMPYLKSSENIVKQTNITAPLDIAGEIKKFAELRDQGLITEDDYQDQKRKLLS